MIRLAAVNEGRPERAGGSSLLISTHSRAPDITRVVTER